MLPASCHAPCLPSLLPTSYLPTASTPTLPGPLPTSSSRWPGAHSVPNCLTRTVNFTNFQTNKVACQFQGCWQNTLDSWGRSRELYYSTTGRWALHLHRFTLPPKSHGADHSNPVGSVHTVACATAGEPEPRNPQSYKGLLVTRPDICPRERYNLYYLLLPQADLLWRDIPYLLS